MELFAARGYDGTTVADIAALAGVTPRTFFRHFQDKREVLFDNEDEMRARITTGLLGAAPDRSPLASAIEGMSTCSDLFHPDRHEFLSQREAVIAGSEELRERESRKLTSLAAAVTQALADRGLGDETAELAGDLALAIFRRASHLWMEEPSEQFSSLLARSAAQSADVLSELMAQRAPAS